MSILSTKSSDAPRTGFDPLAELEPREQPLHGVFEPPNSFVLSALARNKLLIVAVVILATAIGLALGKTRSSTYTAAATLQVGQVNPNSPGFYSYVQSSAALATAFSRAVYAEPVLAAVQHSLKLTPTKAVARLSAEPLPASPAFRVFATGPTATDAVQLANVAAAAVIAYEGKSNSSNPEAESLLHEYREASLNLRHSVAHVTRLSGDKRASASALALAEAEKSAAQVKLKAIANSYISTVASQAPRSGLVSLLAGATNATDNSKAKLESYGLIGLLVGVVIGCLLAVAREQLRRGRPAMAAGVEAQRRDIRA